MTILEKIESELEPKLTNLSHKEIRELARWLTARAREHGKKSEPLQKRALSEIENSDFESNASDVLKKHQELLKKLAQ